MEASGDTDGYFYTNDMAFVTATANDGYEFNGWTVEYKQEDGTYAPAELAKHYSPFGSLDDADLGVRMKDYSLRFTAKFTKQLYVELAAEFVGVTPDADNRVYGPDDSTGNIVATVKATPEEGYAFGGWTILNADTGKKAVGLMGGQYGNYFLEDGESEASNPLRIGFSKHSSANFHVNLKLVPVFGKEMKVTVASDNSEYGTVTPEGENIVSSVGGKLDFGAKPAEDCLFMGWGWHIDEEPTLVWAGWQPCFSSFAHEDICTMLQAGCKFILFLTECSAAFWIGVQQRYRFHCRAAAVGPGCTRRSTIGTFKFVADFLTLRNAEHQAETIAIEGVAL